jgi:hypothetical protein
MADLKFIVAICCASHEHEDCSSFIVLADYLLLDSPMQPILAGQFEVKLDLVGL